MSTYNLERSERSNESWSTYHLERNEGSNGSWSTYHLERSDRSYESLSTNNSSVARGWMDLCQPINSSEARGLIDLDPLASILNLTNFEISPFLVFFDLWWPRITSKVLQSNFFSKLISKALFLGIIRPLLKKIGIWPFSIFLTPGDLELPWNQLFWKADINSFILRYHLSTYKRIKICENLILTILS